MNLRYGDLVQLVERLHALPASRGGATESRIKNFSRLDFPPGPRVGSGERAEYGAAQTIQLLVGFELLRHRIPPAVIAELVRTEWSRLASSFGEAALHLLDTGDGAVDAAPLLLVDILALHEIGKTIRPGELLSTIELVTTAEYAVILAQDGPSARSSLILNPRAILAEVAELLPDLRRPKRADEFLDAVAALAKIAPRARRAGERTMIDDWSEASHSRRRALSDALALLRAAPPPHIDEVNIPLTGMDAQRATSAIADFKGPLSNIEVAGAGRLDELLAIYLRWTTDRPSLPARLHAAVLMTHARFQTTAKLHAMLLATVCSEIAQPSQDL